MENSRSSIIQGVINNHVSLIDQHIKKNAVNKTLVPNKISEIPATGLHIKQPGKYVIQNTITWSPPSNELFNAAIVIESDNVILDFQGYELTTTKTGNLNSFGVVVYNSENITILNGTIKNMGINAICAISTHGLSISKMVVEGLTYPNFDYLPSAVAIITSNSFSIDNSSIKNVTVTGMLAGGFLVIGSTNGKISNCTVDGLTNNDGVACAFPYFFSSKIYTNSCTASNLTTYYNHNPSSKIGHTCIGFMPTDCENVNFLDCTAEHIHGCCDDCHGISLFKVKQSLVTNFTAKYVHDGLGEQKTGAKATGVEVYGDNITIQNSIVSDITAIVPQDLQSTGFSACGTNIIFESCTASNVTVFNAEGKPDVSHGYGTGFGWAPDPREQFLKPAQQVTYKNCTANNCQLGFDTWNHQKSTWINPIATGTGLIYKIDKKGAERVYSMNFCSELPHATPNSPTQYFIITNKVEKNTYPTDWFSDFQPGTACLYSKTTSTPFSKNSDALATWFTTPHEDYNMASLDFYGHLIDDNNQIIGFSSMIQQQFGLPGSKPYLAEFSICADKTNGVVVAPFMLDKDAVTFTSNPYSETANVNLFVIHEKISIELLSGTMGQPNAKYKLTGHAIAFDLANWKYEVELIDTLGAISVGYGPSSFLPQWLNHDQKKAIHDNYSGNVEAYLEAENDVMSGQGSYYYSLPLLSVKNFTITRNGSIYSKGSKGHLWVDYVTQSFSEASFPVLKNDATWQFLAFQFVNPEVLSGALMFSKVEMPVPGGTGKSENSVLKTARFYHQKGAEKNANSALKALYSWNMQDINFTTSDLWPANGNHQYPLKFTLILEDPSNQNIYLKLKGVAIRDNQAISLVHKYEGVYKVTGDIHMDGVRTKDVFLGYAWGEIH